MLRLFKNKLFLLLVATVIIFVVMGISARQDENINKFGGIANTILSPFQKILAASGRKGEALVNFFKNAKELKAENEDLKLRIDNLQKENRELSVYREENKELKAVLNLKDQFTDYDFIGANIIAKDMGNWFNVFRIDRGTKDGIDRDYPVITSKGLVGKVTVPDITSSKVVSIIDEDSTISARISKTRDLVLVKGDLALKNQGLCKMDYIPLDVDIEIGDTIETSGIGGIFPKGIIIGKVKEIRQANSEMNRYAIIDPVVDFKRLESVFVLKSKSK